MLDTRMSTSLFGTDRETRTRTVQGLSLLPLPIGVRRYGSHYQARTDDPHHVKVVRFHCAKRLWSSNYGHAPFLSGSQPEVLLLH